VGQGGRGQPVALCCKPGLYCVVDYCFSRTGLREPSAPKERKRGGGSRWLPHGPSLAPPALTGADAVSGRVRGRGGDGRGTAPGRRSSAQRRKQGREPELAGVVMPVDSGLGVHIRRVSGVLEVHPQRLEEPLVTAGAHSESDGLPGSLRRRGNASAPKRVSAGGESRLWRLGGGLPPSAGRYSKREGARDGG